jgi:hypothetical protein
LISAKASAIWLSFFRAHSAAGASWPRAAIAHRGQDAFGVLRTAALTGSRSASRKPRPSPLSPVSIRSPVALNSPVPRSTGGKEQSVEGAVTAYARLTNGAFGGEHQGMLMRLRSAEFMVALGLEHLVLHCARMTAAVLHDHKVAWETPGRAVALAFMLILTATAVQGHAMGGLSGWGQRGLHVRQAQEVHLRPASR